MFKKGNKRGYKDEMKRDKVKMRQDRDEVRWRQGETEMK